ncbi:MAG: hypothetical protein V7647_3729 [Acidobacteriota bacterium]
MIDTLRAFAWLRWRVFINSLERTGSRDMLERFSLAIEKLGPVLAALMLVPSAIMLASLGAASGYALGRGDLASLLARAPRYALAAVPLLCLLGPLILPAGDRTNPVRMLLLPISRSTLWVAESAAAVADPWVLLMIPLVGAIPLGMAAAGAPAAAALAALAGVLLLLIVVAISATTTSLLHLAVRDRRRGEVLALVFLLIVPVIGMLPSLVASGPRRSREHSTATEVHRPIAPAWASAAALAALSVYPTELYTRAIRSSVVHDVSGAAPALAGLTATALLLTAAGAYAFGKVLESPGSTSARRGTPMRTAWTLRLPSLSTGASAVAFAQVRLALRTPRGRAILLSPLVLVFVYFVINRQNTAGFHLPGGLIVDTGVAIACFGSFVCSLSILPIALNQFAIDKAGLTRVLLSPLSDRDYLAGKAAGNALIAAAPSSFCLVAAFIVLPGDRSVASWIAIPVALVSVYCLVAPAAAMLSALFPRVVDLNSIGRASNAHGLAALLGMVTFVAAAALTAAIAAGATYWFGRAAVTLTILALWCAVCFVVGRILFIPALRVFANRRDNLSML